jgi:hypothetical protein
MRSSVRDGGIGRIIDIAVSEKLERIEARRLGKTKAPRKDPASTDKAASARNVSAATSTSASTRHIPAAVRRRVYARDGGRCAYRNGDGMRCAKRHDLEFHHKHRP